MGGGAMDLNVHDIEAAADTFAAVAEGSDDLSLEDALSHLAALKVAEQRLKEAKGLVETQVRKLLDSPRTVDGVHYYMKADGKWRPNHNVVRAKVISRCAADSNGEMRPTPDALAMAWSLFMKLYVSPSDLPKVTALAELGLKTEDIAEWESKGQKIVAEQLGGPT